MVQLCLQIYMYIPANSPTRPPTSSQSCHHPPTLSAVSATYLTNPFSQAPPPNLLSAVSAISLLPHLLSPFPFSGVHL